MANNNDLDRLFKEEHTRLTKEKEQKEILRKEDEKKSALELSSAL